MNPTVNHCITITLLLFSAFSSSVWGANECRIQYGWNTGNSLQGTFKNHSTTTYIHKGQTRTINKNRMNFVRNLKTGKVRFYLTHGASNVTLNKNQRNPVVGTYVGTPKLVKVTCLNTTTSSASSNPATAAVSVLSQVVGLKNIGTKVKDIISRIKSKLSNSVNRVIDVLKQAGFSANETTKGVKEGMNASAIQVTQSLKTIYNANSTTASRAIRYAGYSTAQAAKALKDVYGLARTQLKAALKAAGYVSRQIDTAVDELYEEAGAALNQDRYLDYGVQAIDSGNKVSVSLSLDLKLGVVNFKSKPVQLTVPKGGTARKSVTIDLARINISARERNNRVSLTVSAVVSGKRLLKSRVFSVSRSLIDNTRRGVPSIRSTR